MKFLYHARNVSISYDPETVILYCNWIGKQNIAGIKKAGAIILKIVQEKKITKVLNNNLEVVGPWQEAANWAAREWFPGMINAGLRHFAWILSASIFSELSAKVAVSGIEGVENVVMTFQDYNTAYQWLIAQPSLSGKSTDKAQ